MMSTVAGSSSSPPLPPPPPPSSSSSSTDAPIRSNSSPSSSLSSLPSSSSDGVDLTLEGRIGFFVSSWRQSTHHTGERDPTKDELREYFMRYMEYCHLYQIPDNKEKITDLMLKRKFEEVGMAELRHVLWMVHRIFWCEKCRKVQGLTTTPTIHSKRCKGTYIPNENNNKEEKVVDESDGDNNDDADIDADDSTMDENVNGIDQLVSVANNRSLPPPSSSSRLPLSRITKRRRNEENLLTPSSRKSSSHTVNLVQQPPVLTIQIDVHCTKSIEGTKRSQCVIEGTATGRQFIDRATSSGLLFVPNENTYYLVVPDDRSSLFVLHLDLQLQDQGFKADGSSLIQCFRLKQKYETSKDLYT